MRKVTLNGDQIAEAMRAYLNKYRLLGSYVASSDHITVAEPGGPYDIHRLMVMVEAAKE